MSSRVKLLQAQLSKLNQQQLKEALAAQQHALPSIEDAFSLPIPAELIQRQQSMCSQANVTVLQKL